MLVIASWWLILFLPLVSFRIGLVMVIFPALEIILVYYFASNRQLKLFAVFAIGLLFDQLYAMPIGTNSLTFVLAHHCLKSAGRWYRLNNYLTNFIIFWGYCLLIFSGRYVILTSKGLHTDHLSIMVFQYITTIFFYPLLSILLLKSCKYFDQYAQ